MPTRHSCRLPHAGFTLMEMIIAITITGIIAGMVAVFLQAPIRSYFDSVRRAALTDVADTAVRRIARDVHLALPNSVRHPTDGSNQCVEFMPTKIGGRYRAVTDNAGNGNPLDFTVLDGNFDMLWPNGTFPVASQLAAGDVVVVFNDGSATGNAYTGVNAIQIAAVCEPPAAACAATPAGSTAVSFVAAGAAAPFGGKQLPRESPFYRFQVVPAAEHVAGYMCAGVGIAGGTGTGTLLRLNRNIAAAWGQPATCAAMAAGAATAVLAINVSACNLHYEPPGAATGINSRNGILSISLGITQEGETVNLYHQVHVDNTP